MSKRHPFFVYGTLLSGQPNDFYWEDFIGTAEPAFFPNGRLFDMGSFPMLLEGGDSPIQGEVVYPVEDLDQATYQLLVQRLDTLENYDPNNIENSPYYRVLRRVYLKDNKPVTAWVYLGRPKYTTERPIIEDGDWAGHSTNFQSHMLDWWATHGHELFGKDAKTKTETDGKE